MECRLQRLSAGVFPWPTAVQGPQAHPQDTHTQGWLYKKASKISSIVSVLGVGAPMMQEVKLLPLLLLSSCYAHAPAPRRTPTQRFVPQGNFANPTRPLVMLPMAYGAASAQMATMACVAAPTAQAVLASTALALALDFGPSATRDLSISMEAQRVNRDAYMANQNVILVDGFVHNIGGRDDEMVERKNDALQRLQDANRWAALVRFRIAIDALGVWLMLRRWCVAHAAGAAVILAGHAMFWSAGGASTRVDRFGNPAPLSPPLVRIIATAGVTLALAASSAGAALPLRVQTFAGWTYSVLLVAIQCARVVADRVRDRTHVGL